MYLVFDVGGTFIKYAWMDGSGAISKQDKVPTPSKNGDGVEDLVSVLEARYREMKMTCEPEGIAISLPGQIDVEKGIVYGGGCLTYLDKVAFGDLLSSRCDGVRVALENDGKCAALAEVFHGNAMDCQDACVLVFGTGIGGGIIRDRKVVRGRHIMAGEVSFCYEDITRDKVDEIQNMAKASIMNRNDYLKRYGYLWGNHTSTLAVTHQVAWAKNLDPESVSGEMIYRWIDEGDPVVIDLMEDMYFRIAKYCCNLHVILDPDIILIGGGISAQPRFIDGILRYVEKLAQVNQVYDPIRVDVCKHRNASNLLGALDNFIQLYGIE